MCTCERALELISMGLDGEWKEEERQELEEHLAHCGDCRALARELEEAHVLLSELEEEEVPEGFRAAVMDRVRADKTVPFPQHTPAGRRTRPWKRWASLAAVFAVVLLGARALPSVLGGGSSGASSAPAAADMAAPADAAPTEEGAAAGGAPAIQSFSAQAPQSDAAVQKNGIRAPEVQDRSVEPIQEAAPAETEENTGAEQIPMTEEERRTLTETCAAWISTSGLEQAEEIDTSRMSAVPAAEADLEAAVWLPEVRVPEDGCWKVTLGGSEACAVLLWDPAAGSVLGWLPAAP